MGCIQALLERPVTIGVKGSHCGGGFFAVKDGGSSGSCIAIIDALCNAVQVVENEPNFEAVKGREGKKTIEESSWPFGEFWPTGCRTPVNPKIKATPPIFFLPLKIPTNKSNSQPRNNDTSIIPF